MCFGFSNIQEIYKNENVQLGFHKFTINNPHWNITNLMGERTFLAIAFQSKYFSANNCLLLFLFFFVVTKIICSYNTTLTDRVLFLLSEHCRVHCLREIQCFILSGAQIKEGTNHSYRCRGINIIKENPFSSLKVAAEKKRGR